MYRESELAQLYLIVISLQCLVTIGKSSYKNRLGVHQCRGHVHIIPCQLHWGRIFHFNWH